MKVIFSLQNRFFKKHARKDSQDFFVINLFGLSKKIILTLIVYNFVKNHRTTI